MNYRSFLIISLLTFSLMFTFLHDPHKISIRLNGSSTINTPADRATVTLTVSAEGSKQLKVARQVRQATDEILNLLRPFSIPSNQTVAGTNANVSTSSTALPPLATLSVDTFSSHSYPRSSILGETTTYSSRIKIIAEFRATPPPTPSNRTSVPSAGFHHLSSILPSLAMVSPTEINNLKWSLSPEYLASLQSEARHKAISEAMTKISDYIAPMQLRYPSIVCSRFHEERMYHPQHQWRSGYNERLYEHSEYTGAQNLVMYDELEGDVLEAEPAKLEVFGLEPQNIEIMSIVEGDWTVTEWSLMGSLLSFFW